ncbi:MAG: TerB N-terminal domain-containing protein [Prevotella sp.]|jgi:hypothetical protein
MSFDHNTSYDDEPLFTNADNFEGSVGGGSWDYVPPEEVPAPAEWGREEWQSAERTQGNIPAKIQELLDMMSHDNWTITKNRAFYRQAMLMADYEDYADIVPFHCYFPTYRDMTTEQLRSYFTVRTMLRQGKVPTVPQSYLFVFVYELLMKVGCESAEDAFGRLKELFDNYRDSEPSINRFLSMWLRDFVVYNNLTTHIPEVFAPERDLDAKAVVLSNRDKVSDSLLFQTVVSLSSYSIMQAALYKKHPKEVEAVVPRVIRAVAPILESQLHHRFETLCLGLKRKVSHHMFLKAVFYDPKPVRQLEVEISLRRKYVCQGGLWSVTSFSEPYGRRGELMGKILHETDRCLRLALKSGPKILPQPISQPVQMAISQTIADWQREEEEARRPKVRVDFSKLDRIRTDAAAVRDALLTEEERQDGASESPKRSESLVSPEFPENTSPQTEPAPLFTPDEKQFMQLLLHDGDWQGFLRDRHILPGVMMDNINSKGMDWQGDVLLEDNGNGPQVIEDYLEDIENEISK